MTCMTMLTHKAHRQFHVSNRLALAACLVLAFTALASLPDNSVDADGKQRTSQQQAREVQEENEADTRKAKLNIRFLLFRHG